MTSRRVLKVAEAVREVVGMAILTDLRDPRIQDVTVTFVEVAPDLRSAKVHVSVMGDEAKQRLSLRGLQNSAGYLQQKVADRVDVRYTPRLQFVLDQGVKNSIAVERILREVLPHDADGDEANAADANAADATPAGADAVGERAESHAPIDSPDDDEDRDDED